MQLHHQETFKKPVELLGPFEYAKKVCICVGIITLLWLPNYFGTPGNALSYGILALMAFRSTEGALKAMLISALIITGNQLFMNLYLPAAVGRYVVIAIAAYRIFIDNHRMGKPLTANAHIIFLALFAFAAGIGALINQYVMVVSLLKLGVFVVGTYVFIEGSFSMRIRQSELTLWFFSAATFFVLGSILFYFTGWGYFKEEEILARSGLTLFCGISNHSQAFGVSAVMIYCYIFSLYLFSNFPLRKILPLYLLAIIYLVYLTDSRTSMLALGGASVLGVFLFSLVRYRAQVFGVFSRLKILVLVAVFAVSGYAVKELFFSDAPFAAVTKILNKGRTADTGTLSLTHMLSGRDLIIQRSFNNFLDNPVTGISFGTALSAEFQMRATWFTAPMEKSFLPTAVLEETGLTGTVFFVGFIVSFMWFLKKQGNMPGLLAFIVMLVLNLGEMMFFSFGGAGIMVWAFMGACFMLGDPKNMHRFMQFRG